MRRLVFVVAPLALVACSQEPAKEAPVEEPVAAEPEPAAMVTSNGTGPGLYEVSGKDGVMGTTQLNADGTYKDMDADGKVTNEGTWSVKDGKTCFVPTAEGMETECFTETAPAEDGSFTVTSDKGESMTVKPLPVP